MTNSDRRAVTRRSEAPRARRVDADKIVALDEEGRTQEQVAAAVGCSVDTVKRYVHEAGVARRGQLPRLDSADIARRYQAGQSIAEIARAIGASKGGVHKALGGTEVQRRP